MFGRRGTARAASAPQPIRRPENWDARRLDVRFVQERRVWRSGPDASWLQQTAAEAVALWNRLRIGAAPAR